MTQYTRLSHPSIQSLDVCIFEENFGVLEQGSPTFFTPRTGYGLKKVGGGGGLLWMGSLKQVCSFRICIVVKV